MIKITKYCFFVLFSFVYRTFSLHRLRIVNLKASIDVLNTIFYRPSYQSDDVLSLIIVRCCITQSDIAKTRPSISSCDFAAVFLINHRY